MIPLRGDTLADVGARIPVPSYDRSKVRTGIVHLGVGGFHRAHQAMYVDTLLERGGADGDAGSWGITGVGVLEQDRAMAGVMAAQDCLYTLVVKHADGSLEPRVIGSIVDYLFAPDEPEAVLARMVDTATRIVSLTVTEGGYHVNQATGAFDDRDPAIRADIESARRGDGLPTTAFGYVTEALARRRAAGTEPFTVMSCDNIQGNGTVAHDMIAAFASLRDEDLGGWIHEQVHFPSSMVDRITPVTTDDDRAVLAEQFGIEDRWPVVCESFQQWALEDDFGLGRPAYEVAGVQVVDDVEPYELMKLRLLNASHQGLCYLGFLSGYRYAHEVCADELFADFLLAYMAREGAPTLCGGARRRPGRLPAPAGRALRQPGDPGHLGAAVRGELRPDPEVAAARGPAQPRERWGGAALGADRRELGAVRRGDRRAGRPDRRRRPPQGHRDGARLPSGRGAAGPPRGPRPLPRPPRRAPVHRALRRGARVAARARRA